MRWLALLLADSFSAIGEAFIEAAWWLEHLARKPGKAVSCSCDCGCREVVRYGGTCVACQEGYHGTVEDLLSGRAGR